jgi:hypothetical protein
MEEQTIAGRTSARNIEFLLDAAMMLASVERRPARRSRPAADGHEAWRVAVRRLRKAVASGHQAAAEAAWRSAYDAAARSLRWDALLAVGDAARRQAAAARGGKGTAARRARKAYLAALLHAAQEHSLDGVAAVTKAFAELGDARLAEGAARVEAVLARQAAGRRRRRARLPD